MVDQFEIEQLILTGRDNNRRIIIDNNTNQRTVGNIMSSHLWTRENDIQLWNQRSKSTAVLADIFGRSHGGIRSRLKHLQNPEHKAYQRRVGTTPARRNNPAMRSQQQQQQQLSSQQQPPLLPQQSGPNPRTKPSSSFHDWAPAAMHMNTTVTTMVAAAAHDDENIVLLNSEQNAALQLVLTGKNVYLTGAAGVGKTFLLRHIVSQLQKAYSTTTTTTTGGGVAVTASTGIAASHLPSSATTLHSFAGIGLGGRDVPKLIHKVRNNRAAHQRWKTTRTLIIDEISMIDGVLFQTLGTAKIPKALP